MSRSVLPSVRAAALVAAALIAAEASAQSYTLYGSGCAGSAGVLSLHHNSLPILGQTLQIELTQVASNSSAVLLFGLVALPNPIDLGFIGSAGCRVYTLPDLTSLSAVTAGNACTIDVSIPNVPGLAGADFHNQWIHIDPNLGKVVVSNAGRGRIDRLPPALGIGVVTPNAGLVSPGQIFTIRTTNLGTNDPDDLCMQLMGPSGFPERSLLRVNSIVFDSSTGEDVVTATLATAAGSPVIQPGIAIMRGDGAASAVASTGCLTAPPSAWAWLGTDLPGMGVMAPTSVTPILPANRQNVMFQYDSSLNALVVDIPPYPWAGSGIYPPGATVTTDAHGDLNCGGSVPGGHFDHFLESVAVKATCVGGLTNQALVLEHAPQIQATFDNAFGVGRLTVSTDTSGSNARILIKPTNPACTLTGGGGTVMLGQ